MYDFQTTNDSFIEICKLYKDEGIKNWYFPLLLYDKSLQGKPIWDEKGREIEYDMETIIKIKREVRINRWYYLREVVKLPEAGGFTRFLANRANIALTWLTEKNISVIEILPRQNGKTWGSASIYTHIYHFATMNSNMIFSNKQYDDSMLNIKRFNQITDLLPSYLKTHLDPKNDTDNLSEIFCVSNQNGIKALSTARDEGSADKLGRGMNVPLPWWDEFSFLKFNKTTADSAAFAYSQASKSAKKNHAPYFRLITTTPNNLNVPEGKYCYQLIQGAVPFSEEWYDWSDEKIQQTIAENSRNDYVFLQFHYYELGKDEEWVEEQKRLVDYDLQKIKREIYLEWLYASEDSVFPEETLEFLKTQVKLPKGSFYVNEIYKFDVFEDLFNITKRNYVISIDIAGALEADSTVITIIDPLTYEPVAQFKSNRISVPDMVELVEKLIHMYFHAGVIVPEKTGLGQTAVQLFAKSSVADHLYYELKEKTVEKDVNLNHKVATNGTTRREKKKVEKRVYGIDTTPKSREIMYKEILNMVVNERPELVNNNNMFEEIKTLCYNKKGKIEAKDGFHDDCIMSYLIGLYMLTRGNNIKRFIKVTHKFEIDEEENTNNNIKKKTVRRINNINNMINQKASNKNLEDFIKASKKITYANVSKENDNVDKFNGHIKIKQTKSIEKFRRLF